LPNLGMYSSEQITAMFSNFVQAIASVPGVSDVGQILANPDLTEVHQIYAESMVAANQRHLIANQQRIASMDIYGLHPLCHGVVDSITSEITALSARRLKQEDPVDVHFGADSLYWISADPLELLNALTVSESIYEFSSITNRLSANLVSRFSIYGDAEVINVRVQGRRPRKVDFSVLPNVRIAEIYSGKCGMKLHLHLYYTGVSYIPDVPYFSDLQIAVVNICFNIARLRWRDVFGDEVFQSRCALKRAFEAEMSLMPAFEAQIVDGKSDGEGDNGISRISRLTSLRSDRGNLFIQAFFGALDCICENIVGYGLDDNIWGFDMHGFHKHASFCPYELAKFARHLRANYALTAQAVGVKHIYNGDYTIYHVWEYTSSVQKEIQTFMTELLESLKNVFNLDEANDMKSTLFFVDFGFNLTHRLSKMALMINKAKGKEVLLSVLGESYTETPVAAVESDDDEEDDYETETPAAAVESDDDEEDDEEDDYETETPVAAVESDDDDEDDEEDDYETENAPAVNFTTEDFDAMLNELHEDNEEEANLNQIMCDSCEDKMLTVDMCGIRNLLGNSTTGKIPIFFKKIGTVTRISNPRKKKLITGGQIYMPFTKNFLRHDVRKWKARVNRFPTLVLELLSDSLLGVGDVKRTREEFNSTLNHLKDTMNYYISQLASKHIIHARYEFYFDVGNHLTDLEWPCTDLFPAVAVVAKAEFKQSVVTAIGKIYPSLSKLASNELGGDPERRLNYCSIPGEALTNYVLKAELAVIFTNPSLYTSRMCKHYGLPGRFYELPHRNRLELQQSVKTKTGLEYGCSTMLLPIKTAVVPKRPSDAIRTTTLPLSRLIASRFKRSVFIPLEYIEHTLMLKHLCLKFSVSLEDRDSNQDEDRDSNQDGDDSDDITESSNFGLFDTCDYVKLHNLLPPKRAEFLKFVSHVLISLYRREWRYHLLVKKKRRANQIQITWPMLKSGLEDLPKCYNDICEFLAGDNMCNSMKLTDMRMPVTSPGELCVCLIYCM
jgi:hypothetical protein